MQFKHDVKLIMKIAMIGARGQWSEYEARNHNNKKPNHPINGVLKTIMINELYCGLIDSKFVWWIQNVDTLNIAAMWWNPALMARVHKIYQNTYDDMHALVYIGIICVMSTASVAFVNVFCVRFSMGRPFAISMQSHRYCSCVPFVHMYECVR